MHEIIKGIKDSGNISWKTTMKLMDFLMSTPPEEIKALIKLCSQIDWKKQENEM